MIGTLVNSGGRVTYIREARDQLIPLNLYKEQYIVHLTINVIKINVSEIFLYMHVSDANEQIMYGDLSNENLTNIVTACYKHATYQPYL